ncbi:hypothetical protein ALC56_05501 [Trachymyrmex septentrionalis]|uniref:General transcription factor II-I repeat domain-containing protein 2B n=1 Tax=Trachymyrmex septentrionalis TaxID=34720 RepID=A0A151JY31_9HYME|nr:hypothetical protein ALC56_05501 [Trachymyrmex septentrionalis]
MFKNVLPSPKTYYTKRYYKSCHEIKYKNYDNKTKSNLLRELKLAIEMAKAFNFHETAESFNTVHLSSQTVSRRINVIGNVLKNKLKNLLVIFKYYSLYLDESTDNSDISQLDYLMKIKIKYLMFYCIIHQKVLCGRVLKLSDTIKIVTKITNILLGNRFVLLSHRKFKLFLDEINTSYSDLQMHSEICKFLMVKCKEMFKAFFFALRKEIPKFLKQYKVDGFRNKLNLFLIEISRNEFHHFSCCEEIQKELVNINLDFNTDFNVQTLKCIIDEFKARFKDFDKIKEDHMRGMKMSFAFMQFSVYSAHDYRLIKPFEDFEIICVLLRNIRTSITYIKERYLKHSYMANFSEKSQILERKIVYYLIFLYTRFICMYTLLNKNYLSVKKSAKKGREMVTRCPRLITRITHRNTIPFLYSVTLHPYSQIVIMIGKFVTQLISLISLHTLPLDCNSSKKLRNVNVDSVHTSSTKHTSK